MDTPRRQQGQTTDYGPGTRGWNPHELARLRRRGERPVGPIVLTEAWAIANWANTSPVGLFAILRAPDRPLGSDADALAGLDVLVVTHKPFAEWQPMCSELVAIGVRFLQLVDRRGNKRSQVVVSHLLPTQLDARADSCFDSSPAG